MKIHLVGIFIEIAPAVVLVAIGLVARTLRHSKQKR